MAKTTSEIKSMRRTACVWCAIASVITVVDIVWILVISRIERGSYDTKCIIESKSYDEVTFTIPDCGSQVNNILHFGVRYETRDKEDVSSESCNFLQACKVVDYSTCNDEECKGKRSANVCNEYIFVDLDFYDSFQVGKTYDCRVSKDVPEYSTLETNFEKGFGTWPVAYVLTYFGFIILAIGVSLTCNAFVFWRIPSSGSQEESSMESKEDSLETSKQGPDKPGPN